MTRRPLLLRLVDELLSGRGIWPAVPAIVVLVVVAVIPFGVLLSLGFSDIVVSRGVIVSQELSLRHLTTALADPLYHTTFRRSLTLALTTTFFCSLLGFPVAYLFLIGGPWVRRIILVLTIAPILTSGIVRTYAWIVILGGRGVVNATLMEFGLISQPLRIINTHWAVLIGMVQIHLPIMILPLIAVMLGTGPSRRTRFSEPGCCVNHSAPSGPRRRLVVLLKPVPQLVALGWPGTAGAGPHVPVFTSSRRWPEK
jgi:ABC-type spermidine/putrescine transport system permease subunit I